MAYGDISLRACYEMSGTGLEYAVLSLRDCYAMSVADISYAVIDADVVRQHTLPSRSIRYVRTGHCIASS
eukprot:1306280-Rhodomonas_salina.4